MSAIVLTTIAVLSPGDMGATLQEAEAAFAAGLAERGRGAAGTEQFRAAAAAYAALCESVRNPLLYRNLGNAYLLADDLPRAVLAYREGLRLSPADSALRRHLAWARERVAFADGSALGRAPDDLLRPGWTRWRGWLFVLTAALSLLGWGCLARWLMLRSSPTLAVGLLALAGAGALTWLVLRDEREPRPVVVLARDGMYLRRGDGVQFPPRYETPLNRGVEAELLYRRGGWLQVELAGGEVGWVVEADAVIGRE